MTGALDLPNELWEIIFFHVHDVEHTMVMHQSLSRYPSDTVPRLAINRRLFPLNRAAFASRLSIHLLCSPTSAWDLGPSLDMARVFGAVSHAVAYDLLERMPFSLSSAVRSVFIEHYGHWGEDYVNPAIMPGTTFDRQVPADVERFNELLIEKLPDVTAITCERLFYVSARPSRTNYILTIAPSLSELKLVTCPVQANRLLSCLATTQTLLNMTLDNVVVVEHANDISRQPFTTRLRLLTLSGVHTSPALEVLRRLCLERSPSLESLVFSSIGWREDAEMIAASSAYDSLRSLTLGFWVPNPLGTRRKFRPRDMYTLAEFLARTRVETLSLPSVPMIRSQDGFSVYHLKELLVAAPSLKWLIYTGIGGSASFDDFMSPPSLLEALVAALDTPGALPHLSLFTNVDLSKLDRELSEGESSLKHFIRNRNPLDRRANRQALEVVAHQLGLRSTTEFLEPLIEEDLALN